MTKRFPIGAISERTMRPEDTVPAMLDTLEELDAKRAGELSQEYAHILDWLDRGIAAIDESYDSDDDCGHEYDELDFLKDALFDALDELAPPFVYFGTLEGDGACIGFWPDIERLNDAQESQCTHWLDDETCYLPEDNVFVKVNDHGNVTLLDHNMEVIWSCV